MATLVLTLALLCLVAGANALSVNCGRAGDSAAFNGRTPRGRYSVGSSLLLSHAYAPRLEYRFRVAPGKQCFVVAKFAEIWAPNGRPGGRVMSVSIGGVVVQPRFDPFMAAGRKLRTGANVVRRFNAPANGIVSVVVRSVGGDANAFISAIDIWGGDAGRAAPGYGGAPNNEGGNGGGSNNGGNNNGGNNNNNKPFPKLKNSARFTMLPKQTGQLTPRHEGCAVLTRGRMYLIGGRGQRPVDVYDLRTNIWIKKRIPFVMKDGKPLNLELNHMQCVAIGARIYVVGAWYGPFPFEKSHGVTFVYNTDNNVWSTLPGMGARSRGSGATVVYAGKIYTAGGNIGGHGVHARSVPWFDVFDPRTQVWKRLGDMPDARDHTGGAVVRNLMCVIGGRNGGTGNFWGSNIEAINCYNFQTGRWRVMDRRIAVGRAGAATGTTCDGHIMLAGGEGRPKGQRTGGQAYRNVDIYDPVGDRFVMRRNMVRGRHGTGLCVADCKCGNIYVPSGSGSLGGSPELFSTEVFSPDGIVRPPGACV